MSIELLTRLQAEHAFDPAPRRADLGAYHVPFPRLGAPRDLEQTLLRAVRHNERLAIVGRSGCGKSSLLAHVLGPTVEHVAPILVRVAPEPADVVASVQSMAAHITQTLVDAAELVLTEDVRRAALADTAPVRAIPAGRAERQVTVGIGWMGVAIAGQLQRQGLPVVDHRRTAAATIEVLDQMLRLISDKGRIAPVLIFDDTDRWLRRTGSGHTANGLAEEFFARVLTELRELSCALVVAVHESYLAHSDVARGVEGCLESRISIPELPDADALAEVLRSRIAVHAGSEVRVSDVFAPSAIDALHDLYRDHFQCQLRSAIRTAHVALTDACDDGLDRIPPQLIVTAAVG